MDISIAQPTEELAWIYARSSKWQFETFGELSDLDPIFHCENKIGQDIAYVKIVLPSPDVETFTKVLAYTLLDQVGLVGKFLFNLFSFNFHPYNFIHFQEGPSVFSLDSVSCPG